MSARIFLVEDDAEMRRVTRILFERSRHRVAQAETAEEALAEITRLPPDVVIIDIHLPGMSGLKLLEILRGEKKTASLPILLLTSLQDGADKVRGLRGGADDYVTKPYDPAELLARVEALLRRSGRAAAVETVLTVGGLAVDLARREVAVDGKSRRLRKKEFELLIFFLKHPGQLLTRERISSSLWGEEVVLTEGALSSQLKNLRSQIRPYGSLLETLIGQGYRLNETPQSHS